MTMTDEELTEIERLANAATPGPWWVSDLDGDICAGPEGPDALEVGPVDWHQDNVLFACAARTAIPALVAEVRRLRREAHCPDCGSNIERHLVPVRSERDALAVEVERLKADVEALRPGALLLTELRAGRFTTKCWSCGTDNEGMWSTCPVCGYERAKEVETP